MQFSTVLATLVAASFAVAAPQNAGSGHSPFNRCNARQVTGNQVVQGNPPNWSDCNELANQFRQGTRFHSSIKVTGNYRATQGTCGFSITAKQGNIQIGKDDIADLIESTVGNLSTKNGAYQTGLVPCDEPGTQGGDRSRQTGWTIGNLDAPGPKQG